MRTIKRTVKAEQIDMGGIKIEQALPVVGIENVDPFLLIHHWKDHFPGGQKQQNLGVGPHPHRGFAPVTLVFKGSVHHRDSLGNDSIVSEGGTQWMNSGKGVIHSERPSVEISENGGDYEIIQFWVNAPGNHKLDPPAYYPLAKEDTPVVGSEDGAVTLSLIAGQLHEKSSPIETYSPMLIIRADGTTGGQVTIPVTSTYNALIYVLEGKVACGDTIVGEKTMALFHNDGSDIQLKYLEDSILIVLAGEPINEPIKSYGPFVMNSSRELMTAIQEYQDGKMGTLVEKWA